MKRFFSAIATGLGLTSSKAATVQPADGAKAVPPSGPASTGLSPEKAARFARAFAEGLNAIRPGWTAQGSEVHGPGGARVVFAERHVSPLDSHVDVGFVFDVNRPDIPVLWDCVAAMGETLEDRIKGGAQLWTQSAGAAGIELKYSRCGEFADHFLGDDPRGLTNWHCICGGLVGFGVDDGASRLQRWWCDQTKVLPAIAPTLSGLSDGVPHAIKIFFGAGDLAEVRVDGEHHEAATEALLALDWPRNGPYGVVRTFVIALHRDCQCGKTPTAPSDARK